MNIVEKILYRSVGKLYQTWKNEETERLTHIKVVQLLLQK